MTIQEAINTNKPIQRQAWRKDNALWIVWNPKMVQFEACNKTPDVYGDHIGPFIFTKIDLLADDWVVKEQG